MRRLKSSRPNKAALKVSAVSDAVVSMGASATAGSVPLSVDVLR